MRKLTRVKLINWHRFTNSIVDLVLDMRLEFVLCFLVGFWGIHRLYTKNIHIGIAQLLLGLGACLGWIMCIVNMEGGGDDTSAIVSIICCIACGLVVGIWALVDSILLLMGKYVAGDGRILIKYTTTQTRR